MSPVRTLTRRGATEEFVEFVEKENLNKRNELYKLNEPIGWANLPKSRLLFTNLKLKVWSIIEALRNLAK